MFLKKTKKTLFMISGPNEVEVQLAYIYFLEWS